MEHSTNNSPSVGLRALIVLCALAVVSLLYFPLPVLSSLEQSHGIGATGMISSFGLAYALGFLIFGPLSDRLGRRTVLLGGLVALTIITVVLATVHTPILLIAGRVLQGFIAASFPPVAIAYLAERGTQRQRDWSVAWMSTAFLSAGLLGQIYGEVIITRWGLGNAFLPLCSIYILTAWQLWKAPTDKVNKQTLQGFWSHYKVVGNLVADARLRRVYVPALVLLLCFVAFYMALDLHLGHHFAQQGISPLLVRALAAPAFLTPLGVAVVMPHLGAQRMLGIGLACATGGMVLSALAGATHLYVLLGASFLFVAGIGISVPSLIVRVASVSEASVRGLAIALYTFVLFIGASVGPWVVQQTTNLTLENIYSLLALLLGGCALYASRNHAGK